MLKWKSRTETTNIGVLELGNITFDEDYMEVSIDICSMSDGLREEVEKAIEIGKVNRTREIEKFNREHGFNIPSVWSDKPVKIDFTYLRVVIRQTSQLGQRLRLVLQMQKMRSWSRWIVVLLLIYQTIQRN